MLIKLFVCTVLYCTVRYRSRCLKKLHDNSKKYNTEQDSVLQYLLCWFEIELSTVQGSQESRNLDFKDIVAPRNSIILLRTCLLRKVLERGINRGDRCCQRTFSTPMRNMNSVKVEPKTACEGLFMILVGH